MVVVPILGVSLESLHMWFVHCNHEETSEPIASDMTTPWLSSTHTCTCYADGMLYIQV